MHALVFLLEYDPRLRIPDYLDTSPYSKWVAEHSPPEFEEVLCTTYTACLPVRVAHVYLVRPSAYTTLRRNRIYMFSLAVLGAAMLAILVIRASIQG